MILREFEYSEFDGQQNFWALKDLTLEKVNLLVGKNATGKTNTITKITWLGNMLAGLSLDFLNSGNFHAEFADANDVYEYYLNVSFRNVILEKLIINGEEKLVRSQDGTGEIYADELKRKIKFQLPSNQLVAVSRRDTIQHPYLKKLSDWVDGLRMYAFGSPLGKDSGFSTISINQLVVDPRDPNQVAGLYAKGEQEFHLEFRERIMADMKKIGYELSDIGVAANPNLVVPVPNGMHFNMIHLSEKDSTAVLFQPDISQGMFRALSLIILMTYNILKKLSTTILIDDIGEGLDYDRSSGIIKLLSTLADNNDIQLIMSTNDRYVMNNVPLEYWQVIVRKGGECKVHNYKNSKKKFDEFEYTGLSNFDFLATDFINSEWESV